MPGRDDTEPDDDYDDRPRRGSASGGGTPVWVWVLGVVGLLGVLGCAGLALFFVAVGREAVRQVEAAKAEAAAEAAKGRWEPYETPAFRVQFPAPPVENQLLTQVIKNMGVEGGVRSVPGRDETLVLAHFEADPKWTTDDRAARVKSVSDLILRGTVVGRRKVTMAGKEWDEISLTGIVPTELATRRVLDTGDRIVILHATHMKGRAVNTDRFLNSFEFVK